MTINNSRQIFLFPVGIDKRLLLLLTLLAVIAFTFWTFSRYPSLDAKALMAGSLELNDQLSFDGIIDHNPGERWYASVAITYINWLYENRQGMIFGIMFAIVSMSMIPLLGQRRVSVYRGFRASAAGLLLGAPLGVCVNCAAPIAFGIYSRGARAELAIATMISSPTFNVIILSMLVALFPWPLVAIKIVLTLIVILIVVPLLVRLFDAEALSTPQLQSESTDRRCELTLDSDNCFAWVAKSLLSNGSFLLLKVLPAMLLAGFVGTVLVTLFPWKTLQGIANLDSHADVVLAMIGLSFAGLLLPVPIAFDAVICAIMLGAGVPVHYTAVLLFTLGSFSIYSFLVLWKAGAKRIAISLYLTLAVCGVLAGVLSHDMLDRYAKWERKNIFSTLNSSLAERHNVAPINIPTESVGRAALMSYSKTTDPRVHILPLSERSSISSDVTVKMQRLRSAGFLQHPRPLIEESTLPFNHLNSLAAGDVNNDNWTDILVGTSQGVFLYLNVGGHFSPIELPFQQSHRATVGAIGLVDLNNDGWLDIYFSQKDNGSYISYSEEGSYSTPLKLNVNSATIINAVGFGDIDRNGELDIVEGVHNGLGWNVKSAESSNNQLHIQSDGSFQTRILGGAPGETLSILISDINADSWLDVMIGNDFDEPDVYFWGAEGGALIPWESGLETTETTMSIDSADIDNNLTLETYHGQVTRNPASPPFIVPQIAVKDRFEESCTVDTEMSVAVGVCRGLKRRQTVHAGINPSRCGALPTDYRTDCLAAKWYLLMHDPLLGGDSTLLQLHYPDFATYYRRALSLAKGEAEITGLRQTKNENLLYTHIIDSKGPEHLEYAEAMGLHIAGWTWNAKFADLDGDGWQDLFVANGWLSLLMDTTNLWFRNIDGNIFNQATVEAGLVDYEPTGASLYVDIDNDGDLDLITFSNLGMITVYQNHDFRNNHLQVELVDNRGNSQGVGSVVTIHHAEGKHQLREIKASGGYLSQDPTITHFGLGSAQEVSKIDVRWSTGELNEYYGPFPSGHRIRLTRF